MIQNAFKIKNGLIVDGNSEVNGYIQFNTGYTATAQTGRVYYDTTENALSYFPTTPNMDVTLNIGQESLIRVFNNTGTQINNGTAIHLSGSTDGLPLAVLANASKLDRSEVSGIATHNIPNGSSGFITNFGIVRDINLSAFRPGDEVYLSDTVDGGLTDTGAKSIAFTSRVNTIGWVISSGATGKLLVRITNEDSTQSLTSKERNILIGNTSSTGVFSFSGMTLTVPVTGTTFNVGPVKAWLVDNTSNPTSPTVQLVQYTGGTGLTSPYLTTDTESYVLLTSAATITITNTFPTPQQRRQNIYLGKLGHPNKSTFNNVFNEPDYEMSPLSQLRDIFTPIRIINSGIIPTAVGGNLSFKNTAGTLYGLGINYVNNILNPNTLAVSANNPTTFQYRTQTGGTATNVTLIDPTLYDVGGATTAVGGGANSSTNQRIYALQNGLIRVQYGQVVYGSLSDAIAGIPTESFTIFPNWRDNAILIGVLSVTRTATDLSISTQANFTLPSKFGDVNAASGGGGSSTTTLQQAYDNSTQPEILTNSTLGAVTFKRGSTADTDRVIEVQNNAGVNTFGVTGLGDISGNSLNLKTYLYDSTNSTGTTNQVLFTSPSGVRWNNIDSIVTGLTNNKVIEAGSGILSTVRINANNTTLGNYSGVLSGTGNTTPGIYSVIAGGSNNISSGNTTSILGGDGNTALSCYSAVVGGSFNRVVDTSGYSVIGGGIYNRITNLASLIGGGFNNTSSGNYSGIVGGNNNKVLANRSLVGGGCCNTASGTYSFIAGGQNNTSVLTNTFLLGSNLSATTINTTFVENLNIKNNIYDSLSLTGSPGNILIPTITGNQWRSVDNVISGSTSITSKLNITDFNSYSSNTLNVINNNYNQFTGFTNSFYSYSSNTLNTINNNYNQFTSFTNSFNSYSANTLTSINNKVIESGSGVLSAVRINANNISSGNYSGVLSGTGNTASGLYSFVGGGRSNTVSGSFSNIDGGRSNIITGTTSSILGGCNNTISGINSIIGGGTGNTVTSTFGNVLGGRNNTSTANNTFILGSGIVANAADTTFTQCINACGQTLLQGTSASSGCALLVRNSTPLALYTALNTGQHLFNGTFTATANNTCGWNLNQTLTQRGTACDTLYATYINPTIIYAQHNQTNKALSVQALFTGTTLTWTGATNIIADFGATNIGTQLTVNDVISGTIYGVNDVSGLPIIDATSNWDVNMYDFPNRVFTKTSKSLILGVSANTASTVTIQSDLIFNEGIGLGYRMSQVTGLTTGNTSVVLYQLAIPTGQTVFLTANTLGRANNANMDSTISEYKYTAKRSLTGNLTQVGVAQGFVNRDNNNTNVGIDISGNNLRLVVTGNTDTYLWASNIITQTY